MIEVHKNQYNEIKRLILADNKIFAILGDLGIGKKTLISKVLNDCSIQEVFLDKLSIDDARWVRSMSIRKLDTLFRAYVINGDNVTVRAYNALLKTLEEPPAGHLFFIVSSRTPISTILSRCNVIIVPGLSMAELTNILLSKGMRQDVITKLLPYAGGSVSEAYSVYKDFDAKKTVIKYFKCIMEKDYNVFLSGIHDIKQYEIEIISSVLEHLILCSYSVQTYSLFDEISISPDSLHKMREALGACQSPTIKWINMWESVND